MESWKQVIINIVDMVTEDKIIAMASLTALGYWTIEAYPLEQSLPILTAIIGGIAGFVTGASLNGGNK